MLFIHVGKAVRVNLTVDGLSEQEEDAGYGALVMLNDDDDNRNLIEDRNELQGPIRGEDELTEILIDYWLREDAYPEDYVAAFDVAGDVRLWTTPDKAQEILTGQEFPLADHSCVKEVISQVRSGFLGFPYNGFVAKYGLLSDNDGKFSIDRVAPKPFHDVWIEVSTPSDRYGRLNVSNSMDKLIVETSPLPDVLKPFSYMHYGQFTGGTPSGGVRDVEFVGQRW